MVARKNMKFASDYERICERICERNYHNSLKIRRDGRS